MKWWSVFQRRGQGWMPVSNTDNHDETDMDDLMRMAIGQYQDDEPGSHTSGGVINEDYAQNAHFDDFGEPVFHHGQRLPRVPDNSPSIPTSSSPTSSTSSSLSESSASSSSNHQSDSESGAICKIFCFCGLPKLSFPQRRCPLVLLSIFLALGFIGLNVGLGCYSLFGFKQNQLVIDKSVKSFSIPNHKAYRNFEALMLARKDNSSTGRHRRSAESSITVRNRRKRNAVLAKESDMLKQTESVLRHLRQDSFGFSRKERDVQSPHLWSSLSGSKDESSQGFSIGSSIKSVLQRVKRRTDEIGCAFDYQTRARWKMHVIYLAHGDDDLNMFTKERLETAHEIEKKIIKHPDFHNFCLKDSYLEAFDPGVRDMQGCAPPNSLLTYFYPSQDSKGNIIYDGLGANIDDIDSALTLAMNHETFYYYVDDKINKTNKKSHLLRSEILFGAPLPGFSCLRDDRKDEDEKFKDFVVTYIDQLSKSSTDKVRVLYGGNEIFDYEVLMSFWSDVGLAKISLIAIFVLMLVLSLSLYLTIVGVIVIALSFPISLFFYRVAFGINTLGILNGAAAFVIIGIGVDDVFVFVNIYRQASHMKDPLKRIWYTQKTASVATFFTSFTTAAAFAANLASSIPAVFEFGLFMSLIVSSCWISVFVMMPPMLYLHACFFEPIETFFFSCCSCISSKKESHYQSSVQHFSRQQDGGHRLYQEDDVPMLDIEMDDGGTTAEQEEYEGMDDDNMLLIDDPYTASDVQPQTLASTPAPQDAGLHEDPSLVDSQNINDTNNYNNMCLGRLMQKMIMFLTNRIVIKGRYIVIVFYAGVLIASCFLMAQLQPSTHPPQLFRPDTNIQQLLDLKANFSIIDALHCDKCSGLYNVKPSVRQWHSTTTAAYRAPQLPARTTKPPHANNWATVPVLTTTTTTTQSSAHENPKDAQTSGDKTSEGGSDGGQSNQNIDVSDATPLNALKATMLKFLSAFSSSSSTSSPSSSQDGGNKDETGPGTHKKETHTTASSLPARKVATPPPKPPEPPLPVEKKGETSHQNSYQGNIEKTHPDWFKKTEKSTSVDENFNACKGQSCNDLKDRPMLESGATVFVVFGITGVDMEEDNEGHVMDKFKGKALFDKRFSEAFSIKEFSSDHLRDLCKICHILANHTELVKPGSAQCIPSGMGSLRPALNAIPECQNLTSTRYIYNNQAPANAEGGLDRQGTSLLWLAFAFESTTSEGQAYFEAYKQYQKWEKLMTHIKETVLSPDSPLQSMFQTSEFWTKVLMEVVAVNSAIYGLVLSMVICVITVAVFTGHFMLLLIVVFSILAMICCVVGVFYLANWEMGVVEAISLSILVGSSVDYCVHVVEGFILAGRRMPEEYLKSQPAKALRQQRTSLAVRHIGVAIVCSALTTIMAAIPLTQTYIQPFAKFGSILLINTTVSMVMTLTLAVALLATFGPARYRGSWKSHVLAAVIVAVVLGLSVLCMYIATTQGVDIPGPSGDPLFS